MKNIIFIILLLMGISSLCGCTVELNNIPCSSCLPPLSPAPQECYITVASASRDVWGFIFVDGVNTGVYLDCLKTVKVAAPCGKCFVVQIIDQWGVGSHWEYGCSNSEVVFNYW